MTTTDLLSLADKNQRVEEANPASILVQKGRTGVLTPEADELL